MPPTCTGWTTEDGATSPWSNNPELISKVRCFERRCPPPTCSGGTGTPTSLKTWRRPSWSLERAIWTTNRRSHEKRLCRHRRRHLRPSQEWCSLEFLGWGWFKRGVRGKSHLGHSKTIEESNELQYKSTTDAMSNNTSYKFACLLILMRVLWGLVAHNCRRSWWPTSLLLDGWSRSF